MKKIFKNLFLIFFSTIFIFALQKYSIGNDFQDELKELGFTEKGIEKIVAGIKRNQASQGTVTQVFQWLVEMNVENPHKIIEKYPRIIDLSIENNLDLKIKWLKDNGVEDISKLLEKHPKLLGQSIKDGFESKKQWLTKMGVKNIAAFIERFPQILSLSIHANLDPKIKWLEKNGIKNSAAFIIKYPKIFSLNEELNLDPKLEWLKKIGIKNISLLLESFPPLLGLNISSNLDPSLNELLKHWGFTIEDLEKNPILFGASLKRYKDLREALNKLSFAVNNKNFNLQSLPLGLRIQMVKNQKTSVVFLRIEKVLGIKGPLNIQEISNENKIKLKALFTSGDINHLLKKKFSLRTLNKVIQCVSSIILKQVGNK